MSSDEKSPETETKVSEVRETDSEAVTSTEKVEASEAGPEVPAPTEEIVEERIYTVPLRLAYITRSRLRRANKAVRILTEFVERHMKPERVLIEQEVNERIWERGIQRPPRRIRIRATKNSENIVRVYLAEG